MQAGYNVLNSISDVKIEEGIFKKSKVNKRSSPQAHSEVIGRNILELKSTENI